MAKIQYAPQIDEIAITAFEKKILDDNTTQYSLAVPFKNSIAIESSDFEYVCLKLKSAQSNKIYIEGYKSSNIIDNIAYFYFTTEDPLFIGQYYKIQISYGKTVTEKLLDEESVEEWVGPYSTTAIVKLAERGVALIDGMNIKELNLRQTYFRGEYSTSVRDPYEKEERYEFRLYDKDFILEKSTGLLVHDTEAEYDEWYYPKDLEYNQSYFIEYIVYTLNGLIISSGLYEIEEPILPEMGYNLDLATEVDYEEGAIKIYLIDTNILDNVNSIQGYYSLSRTEVGKNEWNVLKNFKFDSKIIDEEKNSLLYTDYFVEQGVTYRYGLQRYNIYNLYSERIETFDVTADFEHMYLIDPNGAQLKIKYNPNISSFKNTILETKVDTIGGNFPFIFRNKKVKYKEMNISGLLSYLSDESKLFYKETFFDIHNDDLLDGKDGNKIKITNGLQTFYDERQFKLQVLEWLNNGEVKMLKTPTEGNYLVRLMNVSLSPEKTTGRMLHSFSATAYEIEEYNFHNLLKLDFIKLKSIEALAQYVYAVASVNLFNIDKFNVLPNSNDGYISDNLLGRYGGTVDFFQISGALPGTRIIVELKDGGGPQNIIIGKTGFYEVKLKRGRVQSIKLHTMDPKISQSGILTFNYWAIHKTNFDQIKSIQHKNHMAETIYGTNYEINENNDNISIKLTNKNIISDMENTKIEFGYWSFITFRRRPIKILPDDESKKIIEQDKEISKEKIDIGILEFFSDYYLYNYGDKFYEKLYYIPKDKEKILDYIFVEVNKDLLYRINFKNFENNESNSNIFSEQVFILTPNHKDYKIDLKYFFTSEIELPPGVVMDAGFKTIEKTYDVEDSYEIEEKNNYLNHKLATYDKNTTPEQIYRDDLLENYYFKLMLNKINKLLEESKREGLEENEKSII